VLVIVEGEDLAIWGRGKMLRAVWKVGFLVTVAVAELGVGSVTLGLLGEAPEGAAEVPVINFGLAPSSFV